jgi:hypothetical protein
VPNDAKLGLAAGVAIVLLVAVVFYRTEAGLSPPLNAGTGVAADQDNRGSRPSSASAERAPARTKPTVQIEGSNPSAAAAGQARDDSGDAIE